MGVVVSIELQKIMRVFRCMLLVGLLMPLGAQSTKPLTVNGKKIPANTEDMFLIESALKKALPAARGATVCLELGQGSGSGVIISAEGLILTAAHVTGGVGKEITAILADGRKVKCESLGLSSESDCAMAKIIDKGPFPFVEVDREDVSKLGDWVFSLGHSGGYDKKRGAGVRLGRLVKIANSSVQSDCTLIGGDSGGPLFDMQGRLIGIHSRVGLNIELNMHVPIREFSRHWENMLKGEFIGEGPFAKKPVKGSGFLGVGTEDTADGQVRVNKIGRESPAEKADFKIGDIIVSMDGKKIKDKAAMQNLLKEKAADDKLDIVLLRDGKEMQISLRLGER
jgi:serine protease Do